MSIFCLSPLLKNQPFPHIGPIKNSAMYTAVSFLRYGTTHAIKLVSSDL